jgi:hypothetical protein
VLLGAGALSEEWTGGLLRIALAGPLSRSMFIVGRITSGLVSLLYPFALSCLLGVLVMLLMNVSLAAGDWGRVCVMLALFFVYLAVFYSMGLAVATIAPSGMTTMFAALAVWAILVLVVPQAVVCVVEQRMPAPSQDQAAYERGRIRDKFAREPGGLSMGSAEELRQCKNVDIQRMNRIDAQTSTGAMILGFLPSSAVVIAATHVAGTGVDFAGRTLTAWALGDPLPAPPRARDLPTVSGFFLPAAVLVSYCALFLALAYLGFARKEIG